MARVQVERLRSRAPTAPTARVVDTFVQPQAPDTTPSRAAMVADALGQIAPGVISKSSEKKRKEEMLRAEKAYLMDGMASDIASVANGEKYAQESKVFLRHYKELRTRGYVQQQLNTFGSDLLAGRLTNPDGTPLLVDNIDDYNRVTTEKVSELVGQIDDPLTMDVVTPAINEWKHNTTVSWHSQLNNKLNTDRDRAYVDLVNEQFLKIREIGINGLAQVLSQESDDFYALTKNGKSTEIVVDELISAMNNSGDFAFGDVALRMTQGGNPLSQTLKDKVINAKEALQAEMDADAKARATKLTAQQKEARITLENKVLDGLLNPQNLDNPRAVIQAVEADYVAQGGKKADLYKLLNTVNTVTGFKTPMMETNLTNFKTQILKYTQAPSQDTTARDFALKLINDNAGAIHPDDIPSLLSFAQSAQQSATVLANSEVVKFKKSAVESTLGTVALTKSMTKFEKRAIYDIEQEFDERFQTAYAEAFAADGSVTQDEVRTIAKNVTDALIAERDRKDDLEVLQYDIFQESLGSVRYPGDIWGTNGIEEVEDIRVGYSQQLKDKANQTVRQDGTRFTPEEYAMSIFETEIAPNPTKDVNGQPAWKVFESKVFKGAYAYFYDKYQRR
jgi:hypothetical protein